MQRIQTPTERLWRGFRTDLASYLSRRLPAEDVDDVLQDVFHRIHRSADRLPEVDNVEGWIYGIARRSVADFYRMRERIVARSSADVEVETLPGEDDGPNAGVGAFDGPHDVHEEVLSWLAPTIDELPEMYAVPLRMADIERRSQQEVAETLGLSLSGAKSRIQRARVLLGETLRRCCEIEFGEAGRAVEFRRLQPEEDTCAADSCA